MRIGEGIETVASQHTVAATVERLRDLLRSRGVQLFAVIDHASEAAKVGLRMRPAQLLIFGNPKAGTPLMIAAPSLALDLPLKILVAEDERGQVHLSYNRAEYLEARHGLPEELAAALAVAASLAAQAGE